MLPLQRALILNINDLLVQWRRHFHLLFSKEAMVVTKIDQWLVIKSIAAEAIPNSKALENKFIDV